MQTWDIEEHYYGFDENEDEDEFDWDAADELVDLDELYLAFVASLKGSSWKAEPQRFELDWLSEIVRLKKLMVTGEYETSPGSEFILNERGKVRYVHGKMIKDRVVGHWLCDTQINPAIQPYLIYNNGASQKGKGISFARQEFENDLHSFYLEYGDNQGFIGFIDMSKFYDNIIHDIAREIVGPIVDDFAFDLFSKIVDAFKIDVSYMTDEEYERCLTEIFNSIKYHENVPKSMMTGRRWMKKSVDIGDQVSQSIGMFYPIPIDNYAKIVRGCKRYGRYMDDIYVIDRSKEFISSVIDGVEAKASAQGLFVNRKKTRIVRLDETYQYLQVKYTLSDTGKVVKRINPKSVTRERRKLKAYRRLLDKGLMEYDMIEQAYKSWMGNFAKLMSKQQVNHMKALYKELFGKEPTWKRG